MRIAASLSWWDEPPELLYECVRAIGRLADTVVAVDGAYARYPDGTPSSPKRQAQAIRDAAADAGIGALVLVPDRLWAGQLEKRTYAMNAAAALSDWVATVDADWIAEPDPVPVRHHLNNAERHVCCFTVEHYMEPGETTPTKWARDIEGQTMPVPHLWRSDAAPFRVERFHWWVSGVGPSGRNWLAGGDGGTTGLTEAFPHPYRIVHRSLTRDELRARRNRAFCNDRVRVVQLSDQEDDRPDLPRPVYEYDELFV